MATCSSDAWRKRLRSSNSTSWLGSVAPTSYFANFFFISRATENFCDLTTDRRRTEIARFTSSSFTWSRRCMRADASLMRMMDSMWRTATATPPEADSLRSSV